MRLLNRVLLASVLSLAAQFAHADAAQSERVNKIFAAWDKPDTPGLSLAVVQGGQTVHSRGYGMANLEYAVPNTPSTVFHSASLSKQFTAFAIQLLAQEGKLALDDDVRKYLPELRVQGPPITVRHLLHHTSGLRDQWSLLTLAGLRLDDGITEGDILGLVWQQKQLNFAPGEEELYSNTGYTLLALIVKKVSGQALPAFAQERIFTPLGMKDTHFHDNYGALVKGRAYSYQRSGAGYRYLALSYSNVGATSLFTTVEDLARWDRNFEDARVGGPAVQAAMLVRARLNSGRETTYASGLEVERYRGLATIEHSGGDAGYRSYILRFPQQRLSVLLLGNASDLNSGQLAHRVADVYLEGTPGFEPPRALPAEIEVQAGDLAPYLGDFEMRPGFILSFTAERNQLMVQATGQPRFAMFASAPGRFFTKAFESAVVFPRSEGNQPVAAAVWHQGGRDMLLKRVSRDTPDSASMQACAGDYYSDELRTLYTLSMREGKLRVRYPRGEMELKPLNRDTYIVGYPLGTFTLRRNAEGACEGFGVSTGRVRNLQFQRVRIVPAS